MRAAVADGRRPVEFAKFLATVWADEVVITHTPPMANDGPERGERLGAGEVAIFTEMTRAIPDYHQEDLEIIAEGDVITFRETIVGTLPDGTVQRAPIHYLMGITDGRITTIHGTFDLDAMKEFSKVVATAGLRTPD
jgi:ketosteroid isomerase-like protein